MADGQEVDKEMLIMEKEVELQSQELIMKKNVLNVAKMRKDINKYEQTNIDLVIAVAEKRKEIDELTASL